MSKQEFLDALRRALAQMPPGEREEQLAYYGELIDDMCEDGMSEREAAARLGDPAAIAAGLCVLGALALPPLLRALARLSGTLCRGLWRGLKSIFIKKEN